MRAYMVVIVIFLALMGGYLSVLPLTAWSDTETGIAGPSHS